jgi:hypothetical protein
MALLRFSLHHHRNRFAATDAQTRNAASRVEIFERLEQCREYARAARPDGMTQRNRASSDIHFVRIQAKFAIDGDRRDGERFVDFK